MGDSSIIRLCGYSNIKQKNLKKIKILFDKDGKLGYYIIKIKEISRLKNDKSTDCRT